MSVQVTKTKAEQMLTEAFAGAEAALPGSDAVTKLRREAIGAFSALGLPTRRVEEWKYTDLRARLADSFPVAMDSVSGSQAIGGLLDGTAPGLLPGLNAYTIVFVDGALEPRTLPEDVKGLEVLPLATALESVPAWVEKALGETARPADAAVALNTALMAGGVAMRIADDVSLDRPIHLVFAQSGSEPKLVTTRVIVDLGARASLSLVETHVAMGTSVRQQNTLVTLALGEAAQVAHVKNLTVDKGSIHLSNSVVRLGARATYKPFQMTTGGGLVRHGLDLRFEGTHASLDFAALALPDMSGHVDTTLVIDHRVAHCTSRELYKCVLDGTARGVFQGKVIVAPGAQKTDGKQMAQALMLSPEAEFDSKPELEIYADDVVCGHGSTSAEIDEDLLFYCRSRGIPKAEARALLIESFIGEVIDKVEHEALREALVARAGAWLRAGHV